MKLYRLGKNEIRIHLTEEDLDAFEITPKEFDYDSTKGKRVIWELFDRAKEETGFDAAKEKVYIQLYPKNDGSVELFVTKIEKEEEDRDFYVFTDADAFLSALSLFDKVEEDTAFYRLKRKDCFFALIPTHRTPPDICEFGEKIAPPSKTFLRSQCQKLSLKRTQG
ncbi:MAG: adaptor protein MecA [Clostridia bacterium]|nr:adaptor protein MecA [Clostridia bacterium]